MAAKGSQVINFDAKYESSSGETNLNAEVGLIADGFGGAYGDTQPDLAHMQRLEKKQEFKV
jgi:hypothetical protein